ncbi:MAG: hypothetical protein ACLF0P_01720 [Thermoanaerobaculia bacterium]
MDERRERLRRLTGEAAGGAGRLPEDRDVREPAPGDLYVLPLTAELPVEWALLERDPAPGDSWLAVPADTHPLRGPGDVRLGPGEPGGPLCLRCRFAARLPRAVLDAGRRSGSLPREARLQALSAHRDAERGRLPPDPLGEEAAADPEYRDWAREVLAPARGAAAAAPFPLGASGPAASPARPRALLALAALLAPLAVGLGTWAWQLRHEVDRLSAPRLISGSHEIVVGSDIRGPAPLEWRAAEEGLLVFLVLTGEALGPGSYRVELRNAEDRVLWSSPQAEPGAVPELTLVIPRRFLDRSRPPVHLVLFGIDGDRERRLAAVPVTVEKDRAPAPEPGTRTGE